METQEIQFIDCKQEVKSKKSSNSVSAMNKIHKKAYLQYAILTIFVYMGFNIETVKIRRNAKSSTPIKIKKISNNNLILFEATPFFLEKCKNQKGKGNINTEVTRQMRLMIQSLRMLGFHFVLKPLKTFDYQKRTGKNYKHPIITQMTVAGNVWSDSVLIKIGEEVWNNVIEQLNKEAPMQQSRKQPNTYTMSHLNFDFNSDSWSNTTKSFIQIISNYLATINTHRLNQISITNMFWTQEYVSNQYSEKYSNDDTVSVETTSSIDNDYDDISDRKYDTVFQNMIQLYSS